MSVCTINDFRIHGLPTQAVWDDDWESVSGSLSAAEADILEALRSADYDEPIPETSWTPGMKRRACVIAGYNYLRVRGWQAQSDADAEFVKEYERCVEWIEKVSQGKLFPLPRNAAGEALDAKPEDPEYPGVVVSDTRRGWGDTWP